VEAQMQMAPEGRKSLAPPDPSARQSAVLALIHLNDDALSLPFTLRPTRLGHHGGEISLPGGGFEPRDETLTDTALRETMEELGIMTSGVTVLGKLTPLYIAPSVNMVHPYIGWLPELPPLDPDPREVDAVLNVPLARLLDRDNLDVHHWSHHGERRSAPCYRTGRACIWGATAMILSELLAVIRAMTPQLITQVTSRPFS
jgi:8-oxo-dGTP pyrophosphatase MutT (NUDIX family)